MVENAKATYLELASQRFSFLTRARDCAELTIPTLVPPEGHSYATKYYTPFQGVGARGVNNLASKLLMALLPPNQPFFRMAVDSYLLKKQGGDDTLKTELEKALGEVERAVMTEVETSAVRVGAFEALKHLIVSGNALIYVPDAGGMRVFRMDSYVVKRDPSGNVLYLVTKESMSPSALPKEIRELIQKSDSSSNEKTLELYTAISREVDHWAIYQEINGMRIPGTIGKYALDKNPYIPLRYNRIDGEDYGRGFVEEYFGDLRSLEALTQAIVEGSAAAAKVLFLVNPNGSTRAKTLAETSNGGFASGNAADVTTLQIQKFNDFRVAQDTANQITQRLSFAFLLNSSVQRDAERVTAEEVRFMAQELEAALGGAYSVMSQEFQLPLVNRLMDRMSKRGRLPKLPKDIVSPMIVTGVEALGRGNDLNKLDMFVGGVGQILGPDILSQFVNIGDYLKRRATAIGISTDGLIKSEEEIAQSVQQDQMQMMLQQLGPQGIKAISDNLVASQKTGALQQAMQQGQPQAQPQQQQ
jgi:hypothetical protein